MRRNGPSGDDEYQGDDAGHALGPGATLGATRMNYLSVLRTHMNNGQGRARGHELIWTGSDARTGIYGSALGTAGAAPYRREKWWRYRP
jgi:hypothetical protein